jgi:hypothetical protein
MKQDEGRDYEGSAAGTVILFDEDFYKSERRRRRSDLTVAPGIVPDIEQVYKFVRSIFEVAQFSPECNVIALVYINRLLAFAKMPLHRKNWRPVVLSALLLAQKVWDDECLANVDFPKIWKLVVDTSSLDVKVRV